MVISVTPIRCVTTACWLARGTSATSVCAGARVVRDIRLVNASSAKSRLRFIVLASAEKSFEDGTKARADACLDEYTPGLLAEMILQSDDATVHYRTAYEEPGF